MYSEKERTAANVLRMEKYVQYLIVVRILLQKVMVAYDGSQCITASDPILFSRLGFTGF